MMDSENREQMNTGSDAEQEEPVVAVGLQVDSNEEHVKLQMLVVGDERTEEDLLQEMKEAPCECPFVSAIDLQEILKEDSGGEDEELDAVDAVMQDDDTHAKEGFPFSISDTLPEEKTDEELKVLTREALERYEKDRLEHCELLEKLNGFLRKAKNEKRALLQALTCLDGDERRLAFQEQLLSKIVCTKRISERLDAMIEEKSLAEGSPLQDLHSQEPCSSASSSRIPEKRRAFTKTPFPEWLTENVPPVFRREKKTSNKEKKQLHPLKDMAMQIERTKAGDSSGDKFRVHWIPKGSADVKPPFAARRPTTFGGQTPTQTAPQSVAKQTSTPPVAVSITTPMRPAVKAEQTQKKEEIGADVTLDMTKMGLGTGSQHSLEKQETTVKGNSPEQGTSRQERPIPAKVSAPSGPVEAPDRSSSPPPNPKEQPHLPSTDRCVSPTFQIPAEPTPVQASSIAGGAAFGQSSVPRSNFGIVGIGGVAPQLGSLSPSNGGSSSSGVFNQTGFAGITGGFAAFAQQAAPPPTAGQPMPGGFVQQGSAQQGFAQVPGSGVQQSFSSGGFGAGSSTPSVFGVKPSTANNKLWEMRK